MATERIEAEGLPLLEDSKEDSFSVHFNSGRYELPHLRSDSYKFSQTPLAWHPEHLELPPIHNQDKKEAPLFETLHCYPSEDKLQNIRFHDWLLEPIYRNTLLLKEVEPLQYSHAFVASCVERSTGLSLLYGKMSPAFSIFLPYNLQNYEGTFSPFLKRESEYSYRYSNLRVRPYRFREYLFCLQSESSSFPFQETLSLICSQVREPQPDATWRQLVILEDINVSAFQVSRSDLPGSDFDLLYLVDDSITQISLSMRRKELHQMRKIELPRSHLSYARLLDSSHFIYKNPQSGMICMVSVSQMAEKELFGPIQEAFQLLPSRFSTLILSFKRLAPLSYQVVLRERDSDYPLSLELSSELIQLAETEKEVLLYDSESLHVVKKGKAGLHSFKCPLPNYTSLSKSNFTLLRVGRLFLEEGNSPNHNFQLRLLVDSALLREADIVRRVLLESHHNYRFRSQPKLGTLVAHLGGRHLSIEQSNLTLTDEQGCPRFCTVYANNNYGGLESPLLALSLLQDQSDSRSFSLELWNGTHWLDLGHFGSRLAYWELHAHLQSLLYLVPRRPTLNQGRRELLETEKMGEQYWGVFLSQSRVKWEVRSKNKKQALLSAERSFDFVTVDLDEDTGSVLVRDFVIPIQLEEEELDGLTIKAESLLLNDKCFIYFSGTTHRGSQSHYFFDLSSRQLFQVRAPSLRELTFSQIEERYVVFGLKRWFTLEYLPFRFPVNAKFQISLANLEYTVPEGAQGVVLLVPLTTTCAPFDVKASSFFDYVNQHAYFRFRGLTLDLSKKLPVIGNSGLFKTPRRNQSEQKLGALFSSKGERELSRSARFKSFVQEFMVKERSTVVENMHLHLGGCDTGSLLVLMLAEFQSLNQIDVVFGKGRFVTSLATRIALSESKWGFFLFEKNLLFLHSQAESLGLSLHTVYDGAAFKVREENLDAPEGDNPFKSLLAEEEGYIKHLQKNSQGYRRRLQIYRSALRFPPSRHKSTLQFARTLSTTNDLGIFETRLIQIFISNHWRSSRWLFLVEGVLLLAGILCLALYASVLRSLFTLVPLLGLQMWTFVVEMVELRSRGCGYCRDFWNLFDILRFALTLVFIWTVFYGAFSPSTRTTLFTTLCLVQSVKAFTIFSLFKITRLLLRIVIEIVKDMVPFLLFVLATTLVMALLFLASTLEDDASSMSGGGYSSSLMSAFELNFGEFPAGELSPLQQFLLVVGALAVPLVLLNMLIAIMSDTFDRVREDQTRRDLQEQIKLVYRYEIVAQKLCRCRKKKAVWKYIFFSREKREENVEAVDAWQGRVRGIKSEIQKLQSSLGNLMSEKIQEAAQRSQQQEKRSLEWQKVTQEKLEKQQREIRRMKTEIMELLEEAMERWEKREEVATPSENDD